MNAPLSRNATVVSATTSAPRGLGVPFWDWRRRLPARRAILDYFQVLGGASGRLALQTLYFLILANTLSLGAMGVFASVSAAGMIIGCFTGLGFQAFLFRSAASRPSALGGYFAAYYVAFAATLPIGLAIAGALYWLLFEPSIGALGYFTIIFVEIGLWRFIEMLVQVNNGLGRYSAGANVLMGSAALRTLAAIAFLWLGGGDAARWSIFYFAGNAAAFAALGLRYHPRVKLRWSGAIFARRWRDGLLYAFSYCSFFAQNEVDKLVILWFAGDRMTGVYAIAMRMLDLTAAPLRPLFVIYSRRLLRAARTKAALLREIVQLEAVVATVSIALLAALVVLLGRWPNALGRNVASAYGLLAVLLAAPALKNLIELHGELLFALDRLALRGAFAGAMVVLKAAALALLLYLYAGDPHWGAWLNAIYVGLYFISLATVRMLIAG